MARYTGPKNRLSRREGIDLGLQTPGSKGHAQLLKRLKITPGQHGARGHRRKASDYGIQLREKQKVKRLYGIQERQFRKYFDIASRDKQNTGQALLIQLERRLDNCLYRAGIAPTRASARQFVSHGHVLVDGKRVNIPSFQVRSQMVISPRTSLTQIPAVKKLLDEKSPVVPKWVERKGPVFKILRMPVREDVTEDINEQLIIEFYSR